MDLFDLARYPVLNKNEKTLLFEAFSGIGTQSMAYDELKEILGIDFEVIGFSDIDKYAIQSYYAIRQDNSIKNYGDISKMVEIPFCHVCTWSFPCQDISLAGHQKGMVEGTKSNYGYEFLETVRRSEHKPKILVMENVKALVSERFQDDFKEIQERLKSMGYENHWKVLNAKHYGVAQNRERVFMISILGGGWFQFPPKIKLTKKLKDYLEDDVDEKYYLSEKQIEKISNWKAQQKPLENILDENSIVPTITARGAGENHSGMILFKDEKGIRVITPFECWRLMGIKDEYFWRAKNSGVSNTQLYKQAGNAIVVNVLVAIFKNLY